MALCQRAGLWLSPPHAIETMCETLLHRRRQRVGTALWLRARAMHYYCAAAGWAHGHGNVSSQTERLRGRGAPSRTRHVRSARAKRAVRRRIALHWAASAPANAVHTVCGGEMAGRSDFASSLARSGCFLCAATIGTKPGHALVAPQRLKSARPTGCHKHDNPSAEIMFERQAYRPVYFAAWPYRS